MGKRVGFVGRDCVKWRLGALLLPRLDARRNRFAEPRGKIVSVMCRLEGEGRRRCEGGVGCCGGVFGWIAVLVGRMCRYDCNVRQFSNINKKDACGVLILSRTSAFSRTADVNAIYLHLFLYFADLNMGPIGNNYLIYARYSIHRLLAFGAYE